VPGTIQLNPKGLLFCERTTEQKRKNIINTFIVFIPFNCLVFIKKLNYFCRQKIMAGKRAQCRIFSGSAFIPKLGGRGIP